MAEGIASGLVQTISTQLGSLALEDVAQAPGVKEEVTRLQNTLAAIKDVLPHAENLQLSNNDVKSWLRRIKDAAYDAEDVIDDFATKTLRRKLAIQGGIRKRVRQLASSSNSVVLRFKMPYRIKEVGENLKNIFDHRWFRLQKGSVSEGRQTHSYIPEGKVVGRDKEKEKLVKLLLDSGGRDTLSVIPIQGMGGIGKTALAQFVYNDERVIDSFKENRMWVCVSDDFDIHKITAKIIRSGTNEECQNLELDQLQYRLRQHLGGKRYLLVLDDIWKEESVKWEELRDLLIGGASGSKIIVTTQSERVGLLMGTTALHRLSKLSEDDCWELFRCRAFSKANEDKYFFSRLDEDAYDELVKIGREIAKKCAGVPLAAKTLGSLCYQAKKETWEFVRDSDVWRLPEERNDILRALRISYNHLSFSLKQCFAYCSIFPKDYTIEKDMLIRLWIAQGFIVPLSGEERLLEEIGNEYVEILMWRSFFQQPEVDEYDNLIHFKMHELVHDLAKSVAGVECLTVSGNGKSTPKSTPNGVRHLFFNVKIPSSLFKAPGIIPKPSNIRTLMFDFKIEFSVDIIFSSLKLLRVLKFKDNVIQYLPKSIDELKHLRYLEIKGREIRKLPKSITKLQNLQVLKLKCSRLEELPSGIQNMINLRHIDFKAKKISVSHMPRGLEELKSLQTLSHFVVGKYLVGCDLNGLNGLTSLRGSLEIWNLQNVQLVVESKETNLKEKINLQELRLVWGEEEPYEDDIRREAVGFEVLENLEPPSNLKRLRINGYVGTAFPRWMMEVSSLLPNLVEIELQNCRKCEQLPRFSHLSSLKFLRLWKMVGIQCIEGRAEESWNEWFPSLTRLQIEDCPNLESWFPGEAQEEEQMLSLPIPNLVRLDIVDCPKLKNIPPLLPSIIKTLHLYKTNVHSLDSAASLTSLDYLSLEKCEGLESWPNWLGSHLTSLRHLIIGCTRSLPYPQQIQHLPALRHLEICDYCEEALPEWMANITSLGVLAIRRCPNLQILPEWVLTCNTTIGYLLISYCPHLVHRYNKENGEDRPKIAHIPNIHLYS